MPMLTQVGGTIPTYCSGLGRAMLAYSQAGVVDAVLAGELPARTRRTLTDPDAIRRDLAAIPDRGWAVDREEGNIGVSCVAAAIFGPGGEMVAALSITGPSAAVRPERAGPAVRLAAAAASRALVTSRR
jgi:DNA-binding IclR family transcriptional regulator